MKEISKKNLFGRQDASHPLWWFLFLCPFAVGLFFEWLAALGTLFLLGYLIYLRRKNGKLNLPLSLPILLSLLIVLFYGTSVLWAVDKGMTPFGFVNFLPVPLFALTAAQVTDEQQKRLLDTVPLSGVGMTALSSVLRYVPVIGGYFTVSGRLAGFLQYPNTFALFLLLGVAAAGRKQFSLFWLACEVVLLLGIFQSGSRSVLAVSILVLLALCFLSPGKRGKLVWAGLLGMGVLVVGGYLLFTGCAGDITQAFSTALQSSTFLGRLLYWKDAFPVILTHPLGLGYGGYRSLQGSFQTGVYYLQYVHNGFLQIFLDIGWLPGLALPATILASLFSKRTTGTQKFLLVILTAHAAFDFDLQYLSVWFVLLLLLDDRPIHQKTFTLRGPGSVLTGAALACFSLYFGITCGLAAAHRNTAAVSLYPAYTSAWEELLIRAETPEEMDKTADRILGINQSVSLAWSAKARVAFSVGDFQSMMECKEKAIALSKYEIKEYLDYFDMLYTGMELYAQAGDTVSAEICRAKLLEIPGMLEKVLEESDPLAWKIDEKPELELPEKYLELLQQIK